MKKTINSILVILTLGIWGFIILSIAEVLQFNYEPLDDIRSDEFDYDFNTTKKEEFRFEVITNDPFTTGFNRQILSLTKSSVQKSKPSPVKSEETFNFIVKGVVINNVSKSVLLVDTVSGGTFFLKEGEKFENYLIERISKNSVEILSIVTGKKTRLIVE